MSKTLESARQWLNEPPPDNGAPEDDDLVDMVRGLVQENSEMLVLLRDIYRVCGASSRASRREQTAIFQRLREALDISVYPLIINWWRHYESFLK